MNFDSSHVQQRRGPEERKLQMIELLSDTVMVACCTIVFRSLLTPWYVPRCMNDTVFLYRCESADADIIQIASDNTAVHDYGLNRQPIPQRWIHANVNNIRQYVIKFATSEIIAYPIHDVHISGDNCTWSDVNVRS
jgi:hypothetical protein